MDIKSIIIKESSVLKIKSPIDKTFTDIEIELHGVETPAHRSANRDLIVAQITARGIEDDNERDAILTQAVNSFLADMTKSWKNVEYDGKTLECTKENALKIYNEAKFIADQVDEHISNSGNFYEVQKKK